MELEKTKQLVEYFEDRIVTAFQSIRFNRFL
ncbi:hypothetical protein SAMN05421544_102140 [Riemerella columbipharyngis]|uniref:Uncharacterized protein n=1 Tax=Riemerella columbipharyngis TaxID=1071918 RepID=A0A1G6ZPK3_9FLAO|nr:hypothetical protein SAMN05421544_102140 [Riemerella columbipharyngis]